MTKEEHLLCCLAEECAEVAHRVSKALRFGLGEVQSGQPLSNGQRISQELNDLVTVASMLIAEKLVPEFENSAISGLKMMKVLTFLEYAEKCGTVHDAMEVSE